ncbi:MAG: EamA family transporter [Candidatus Woesearchaeota archaeon]
MKTEKWAKILIIVCTALISIAQILYKIGSEKLEFNISGIFNLFLISGLILYGIGALLMILSFKGGDVSSLYPILGTSYIWVTLLSWHFLDENLNFFKIFGIGMILLGITYVGKGSE